jgi:hypothetical protein
METRRGGVTWRVTDLWGFLSTQKYLVNSTYSTNASIVRNKDIHHIPFQYKANKTKYKTIIPRNKDIYHIPLESKGKKTKYKTIILRNKHIHHIPFASKGKKTKYK